MVGHFGGGGQKRQHIGAALRHHGHLGQVCPGLLHLHHAGDKLCLRRRFPEVVAGTYDLCPGGVGVFDQPGQIGPGGEEFNVDQISTICIENGTNITEVFFMRQADIAALGFCAEGDEKKLILQGNTQLCRTARNCTEIFCTLKQVNAPFHAIRT